MQLPMRDQDRSVQDTVLNEELLKELASFQAEPCLSLYQPTHRSFPDNQQDPIRFRNLLKELEASLAKTYSDGQRQKLLQPWRALGEDREFWNHTLDGLAVFGSTDFFRVVNLPRSVTPWAVVADSFHTKPLRRWLQSSDRFQILGLSRDKVRIFEGSRDGLVELEPSVPASMADALGTELTEPHLRITSQGGAGPMHSPMHHGHGSAKEEVDTDVERFFRTVDRAVWEDHSRNSGLPLLLAALPEHHHRFRSISENPRLFSEGIKLNPEALDLERLRQQAWEAVEPLYRSQFQGLCEAFAEGKGKGTASDSLRGVAKAAAMGQVRIVLLESDRRVPGRVDRRTGKVRLLKSASDPKVDDVLDDLADLVQANGGLVRIAPADRMPTETGVAALFRY